MRHYVPEVDLDAIDAFCIAQRVVEPYFGVTWPGRSGAVARWGPEGHRPEAIAAMMLELQDGGYHNINFVTPEHVVPQVIEAVAVAVGSRPLLKRFLRRRGRLAASL